MVRKEISRRTALGLGVGAVGAAALSACSSDGATTGPDSGLPLPKSLPPKKLPGTHLSKVDGVAPAYEKLPMPGYTSVQDIPGKGSSVSAFTITYGVPPLPLSENVWHQEVNKALGVELDVNIVPAQNFGEKLVTTIASGDIPDLTTNEPTYRGRSARKFLPQGAFWDLRELLGGDKVEKYPNLARIPEYAWQNSRINGALYGVPNFRNQQIGGTMCFRQDWAEKGGMPSKPTNVDELHEWLKAMKAGGGEDTYPLATIDQCFNFCGLQVYGAPNVWKLNDDGTLIHELETDEYEQALVFANKLWNEDLIHPDVITLTPNPSEYSGYFYSGRVGVGNGSIDAYFGVSGMFAQLAAQDPSGKADVLIPPGVDGGVGMIPPDLGFYGMLSIPSSVTEEDRLDELLRIIDFFTAPLGSKEYNLVHYGVEGHNYTVEDGVPVGSTDEKIAQEAFLGFLGSFTQGFYFPGAPADGVRCQRYAEQMVEAFVPNPTAGLDSPTSYTKGDALAQLAQSYEQEIVTGRKSIDDLEDLRSRWKSGGGDQMRSEYEEQLSNVKPSDTPGAK